MGALVAFPADRWQALIADAAEAVETIDADELERYAATVAAPPLLHVRVWSGSRSGRVTEMTNAGRVGKLCRVIRVLGDAYGQQTPSTQATFDLLRVLEQATPSTTYERVLADLQHIIATARAAGVSDRSVSVEEETIKGIRAPRVPLVAGVSGLWSGGADESGISLSALNDVNEWREITHGQTGAAAYAIAARVWPAVQQALTLHAAAEILRAAGARLHGYCGMD